MWSRFGIEISVGLRQAGTAFGRSLQGEPGVRLLLLAATLCPMLPQVLLGGLEPSLADDAYYYLLPAANFWSHGFYTFDGLTHTNGFHPLWAGVLTVVALPFVLLHSLELLPFATQAICVLLVLYAAQAWYGTLRRLDAPPAACIPALVMATAITTDINLMGLETAISFAAVSALCFFIASTAAEDRIPSPFALALLSLLVFFARLDGAILLMISYVVLAPIAGLRRVILAGILLIGLASPYLALNQFNHGHIMPISGRVKEHWGDRYELETSGRTYGLSYDQFRRGPGKTRLKTIRAEYLPRDFSASIGTLLPASMHEIRVLTAAAGIPLVLGLFVFVRAPHTRRKWVGFSIGAALLVHYGFILIYYALNSDRVWEWYTVSGVAWFGFVPVFCACCALPGRTRTVAGGLATLSLVLLFTYRHYDTNVRRNTQYPRNLDGIQIALGNWIKGNAGENEVSAGWAVGLLGWTAQRPVINLEGLAGDKELLARNMATDLIPFLVTHDVAYIATFWRPSYAPAPGKIIGAEESDFAWAQGKNRIRYFWTLRLRPLIDCPQAFGIVHHCEAKDWRSTEGFVLSVEQETLATYLESRNQWRAAIDASSITVPAENCIEISGGRIEANARRTCGYYVRAKTTKYRAPGAAPGEFALFGRLSNVLTTEEKVAVQVNGTNYELSVPPGQTWSLVQLTPIIERPASGSWTIQCPRAGVCIDELYLVSEPRIESFKTLMPDWWRDAAPIHQAKPDTHSGANAGT